MSIAIVTGASSGIGAAFARKLATKPEVDALWLVARRTERLKSLADELGKPCTCISADLASEAGLARVEGELIEEQPDVAYLVNAAGFGKIGTWETIDAADNDAMIDLNCRAMVHLTTSTLPYMRAGSHVFEVVSCAAFTPLPHMNVYAASKAFMQSYTRGLRWEIRGRGICATAVCPSWVKTEFTTVAKQSRGGADIGHFPFAQKPSTVATRAIAASNFHFAIATCGLPSFFLRVVGKFFPHCITMAGWEAFRRV